MKSYSKILPLLALGLLFLGSCKKDEAKVYLLNTGSTPVLTSTAVDSIPLHAADSSNTAVTFNWTNPNYQFSDGISSQNVTYYLEIDTVGGNFSSPVLQTISISQSLQTSLTVANLNSILANAMGLTDSVPHNIQVRIESFIQPYTSASPLAATAFSTPINYTVVPYVPPPIVAPPSSGTLYITGSATPDGWMVGGQPSSVAGQQFTQVTPTLYKITLTLIGGQQFLTVPVAGDWGNKYATSNGSSGTTGGSFGYNAANNFNGPAANGTYTVTFNFQNGTYSIQ